MYDLKNKNILIVGASSGIGKATAFRLGSEGSKVILVARREEELKTVIDEIGEQKAVYYQEDVSYSNRIEGLVKRIVTDQGKLDGMVYAAGIVDDVPIKFLDHSRLVRTFDINFFSFIEFVRELSKRTCYNPGLRIVAISSISSIRGEKAHTSYAASKAAMDSAVRCLAKELWEKGISINSVQPGMIRTRIFEEYLSRQGNPEEAINKLTNSQYAGIGEPEDVANLITFLLSSDSGFITGASFTVDGGASSSS